MTSLGATQLVSTGAVRFERRSAPLDAPESNPVSRRGVMDVLTSMLSCGGTGSAERAMRSLRFRDRTSAVIWSAQTAEPGARHGDIDLGASSVLEGLLSADVATQIAAITDWLSINKSQLASVLLVSRPTIYEWLGGSVPSEANMSRLTSVLEALVRSGVPETDPLNARFVRQRGDDVPSLIETLSMEHLDQGAIQRGVERARRLDEAARRRALDKEIRVQRAGIDPLSREAKRQQLADNVALRNWPEPR